MRRKNHHKLDTFINDHQDLCTIRDDQGIDAARAKAVNRLDSLSKSKAEREKLTLDVNLSIHENGAKCRAAMDEAYKSLAGTLLDLKRGCLEEKLDDLPDAVKESYQWEKMAQIEKLRNATMFSDVVVNDWDRINMPLKAAREREARMKQLRDNYEKQQKENENHAQQLLG